MNTVASLCRRSAEDCLGAIDEIETAQGPDSDGGENITPMEAARIRLRVLAAAALSNNAAEIARSTVALLDETHANASTFPRHGAQG